MGEKWCSSGYAAINNVGGWEADNAWDFLDTFSDVSGLVRAHPLAEDQVAADDEATGCGSGVSGGISCRQEHFLGDAEGMEQRE